MLVKLCLQINNTHYFTLFYFWTYKMAGNQVISPYLYSYVLLDVLQHKIITIFPWIGTYYIVVTKASVSFCFKF